MQQAQDLSTKQRKELWGRIFAGSDGHMALQDLAFICEIGRDVYSTDTHAMARATGKQSVYFTIKSIIEDSNE